MLDGKVHAGHTTTELFASGGVHALVRLLDNVLEYAREPQRSVWVREVLPLLYPLVRRSRMVARLLVSLTPSHSGLSGCHCAMLSGHICLVLRQVCMSVRSQAQHMGE